MIPAFMQKKNTQPEGGATELKRKMFVPFAWHIQSMPRLWFRVENEYQSSFEW